jgi:hypothetical protein
MSQLEVRCACGHWVIDLGKKLVVTPERRIPREQRVGDYGIGGVCSSCGQKTEVTVVELVLDRLRIA